MERKDGIAIVPIDENGNLIMLSEYCAGSNSYNFDARIDIWTHFMKHIKTMKLSLNR